MTPGSSTSTETPQITIERYHRALNNLLALVHRDVQDTHALKASLVALGIGHERFGLPVTVAFVDQAREASS